MVTEELVISRQFRNFCIREKVNNFVATPYIYYMLLKVNFWDAEMVKSLNRVVAAGEKMSEDAQENMAAIMGDKFWYAYGQTECAGYISDFNVKESNMKMGAVGQTLKHVKARIDNKTNELIVESGSVCMGYVNNKKGLAQGDVNQGILYTGDLAFIDKDGFIYLKGRLKRYVKVLGKKVSLDELEIYLKNKFSNVDIACNGVDDRIFIFHTGVNDDLEKKIATVLDRGMKIPCRFVSFQYLKEIPRNLSGKIAYAQLDLKKNGDKKYDWERRNS